MENDPPTGVESAQSKQQRYTAVVRRGIPHLVKYLKEDVDHEVTASEGPIGQQHPMYRRLSTSERRELRALVDWLIQEQES